MQKKTAFYITLLWAKSYSDDVFYKVIRDLELIDHLLILSTG